MFRFRVGDKIKLKEDGGRYVISQRNFEETPMDCIITYTLIKDSFPKTYEEMDMEPVTETMAI